MHEHSLIQPQDLSDVEWSILQHLATLTATFYLADAALGVIETSTSEQLSSTYAFNKHFERLRAAGYLIMEPEVVEDMMQSPQPLYTLSEKGRKAILR